MNLVYVCKNSWWDSRKARKVLLPLAVSKLPDSHVLLVNAARPIWVADQHPKDWQHPDTGMNVFTPVRVLPFQRFSLVRKLNQWFRWRSVHKQIELRDDEDRASIHFILSDPEDIYLAGFIRQAGYACYFDWTEKWDAYAMAAGDESQSKINANEILANVDGVIVVSSDLEREAESLNLHCLHLPNAVSQQFVEALGQEMSDEPAQFKTVPKPRVIHVGSYNPAWIHWDWLCFAAKENPDVSFCMLGGGGDDTVPDNIPFNIYLLGRVAYEDIPSYMNHAQGCLLLYKVETTLAGDPTKLYEYLATGLPIVSSPHPRCLEFEQCLYVANSANEFSEKTGLALNEDVKAAQLRIDEATHHTWSVRARALVKWLES